MYTVPHFTKNPHTLLNPTKLRPVRGQIRISRDFWKRHVGHLQRAECRVFRRRRGSSKVAGEWWGLEGMRLGVEHPLVKRDVLRVVKSEESAKKCQSVVVVS